VGMADGYATATRKPTVVTLHAAPGLANGLAALANARRSGTPLVVIAGQQDSRHLLDDPILSGDLVGLASQFCKSAVQATRPDDVVSEFSRAWDLARSYPTGPTFLAIPMDVFGDGPVTVPPPVEVVTDIPATRAALDRVVALLREAQRPAVVAGDQVALDGGEALLSALGELLAAPIYAEPAAARMVLSFTDPSWAGYLPLTVTGVASALRVHDVVLVVGARPFTRWLHEEVPALTEDQRLIVADPRSFRPFVAPTLHVLASPRAFLEGLVEALGRQTGESGYAADRPRPAVNAPAPETGNRGSERPSIRSAVAALLRDLPPEAAVVDDSVSGESSVRRVLGAQGVAEYYSCKGGGLGWGVAFAVGVALARTDRPVLAVLGDGTLQYAAPALWTCAHHRLPVVFAVLRNDGYGILKWVARSRRGDSARWVGLDICAPEVNLAALATAYGVEASVAPHAGAIADVMKSARPGPLLVDIPVDTEVADWE